MVGVAVKVTDEPEHAVVFGVEMLTDGVTDGVTFMVKALDVAVVDDGQLTFDVMTQVTTSPLPSVVLLYVVPPVPTLLPLTFHWYAGAVPPLVGTAVNVTELPAQTVRLGVEMLTDGVRVGLMVIVIALDVAGLPATPLRFEVMTQVTACPVVSVLVLNVALLVPALAPLTFH